MTQEICSPVKFRLNERKGKMGHLATRGGRSVPLLGELGEIIENRNKRGCNEECIEKMTIGAGGRRKR